MKKILFALVFMVLHMLAFTLAEADVGIKCEVKRKRLNDRLQAMKGKV